MKKKEAVGLFWLIVIGLPIFLIYGFAKMIGAPLFLLLIVGIIAVIWYADKKRKERIAYLMDKYNNQDIVDKIMKKMFWQGQSAEQLLDSLGNPVDKDENILKTKKKEVWKYSCDGVNRYRLRITLENDFVVGWDQR